jgi:hypothetical protein
MMLFIFIEFFLSFTVYKNDFYKLVFMFINLESARFIIFTIKLSFEESVFQ